MRGFLKFSEITGRDELFPEIIKVVAGGIDRTECKCVDDDIFLITTKNARMATNNLFEIFYGSLDREEGTVKKENVLFDCRLQAKGGIKYSDYLFAYKKRDFDEIKEKAQLKQASEKTFRSLLNEYIINFHPKIINEKKNLWLDITPQGKFVAIKYLKGESIICDLSVNEQTLFNFLCFIEINAFRQFVNGVRDFNYREKPLIVTNFSEFLDEGFDYASFLKEQKLNRKIFLIKEVYVPKKSH